MSSKKAKAKLSSSLLNTLNDMKDVEFGDVKLTVKDVPQLGRERNNNSIPESRKRLRSAGSIENSETPQKKTKVGSNKRKTKTRTEEDLIWSMAAGSSTPKRRERADTSHLGATGGILKESNVPVDCLDQFLQTPYTSLCDSQREPFSPTDDTNEDLSKHSSSKVEGKDNSVNVEDNLQGDSVNAENGDLDGAVSSVTFARRKKTPKAKDITPAEKAEKKRKILKYLHNFMHVSSRYSAYLEGKISSTTPTGKGENKPGPSTQKPAPPAKKQPDVSKSLNLFKGELHPYQLEGVNWLALLYENSVNGILADEMGLGKTVQIIALFCYLFEKNVPGPFLIVVPLSTLGNWESEFKRFAPKIPVVRLQGDRERRYQQKKAAEKLYLVDGRKVRPVVLVSYQVPQLEEAFLQKFKWQYIVIDEAQRIKNSEAKLSQLVRGFHSVNRTLLTGTPLQNDIKELWALFNFLIPDLFQDCDAFSSLLELDDMKDKTKLIENEVENKIITTIHKVLAPFMLRREKKFVLEDIVPKKEVIIFCSLTKMQEYQYRATLQQDTDQLMMMVPESEPETGRLPRKCKTPIRYDKIGFPPDWATGNYEFVQVNSQVKTVHKEKHRNPFIRDKADLPFECPDCQYMCYITMNNTMMMLRKIVNHPYLVWCPVTSKGDKREVFIDENVIKQSGKLLVLDALLPKLKAGGHKVLIFSTLVMFLEMIEEMLILRGYNYRMLVGASNFDNRNEAINDFMTDPDVFIFLLSTRAGGVGLNLTAADTVIFMDRDWNPMVDIQAQDRCHRIGQTKPVMVYSLICKGTCDEVVLNTGDMKRLLERVVLQEGKFKSIKKVFEEDEVKMLEDMLNNEQKLTEIKPNGLRYTDAELDQILDRSELWEQIKKQKEKKKQKV